MKTKTLLNLGYFTPIVFWLTLIICGWMTADYSTLVNLVSELGAQGTHTQYLFSSGLVVAAILSILFIIGLFRVAKRSKLSILPIILILTFSFSIFFAAIFPLPMRLHGILGSPSMLLPLSPLLAVILWKNMQIRGVKFISAIVFFIMMLGFLTMVPEILDNYFGLKQRIFHIGWTLWFVYLANRFRVLLT